MPASEHLNQSARNISTSAREPRATPQSHDCVAGGDGHCERPIQRWSPTSTRTERNARPSQPTPRSRIRTTHPRQLPREPRTWPQSDTNTALCLPLPGVLPLAAPATPRRRFAFFVRLADCARGRNPASVRARTARGGWLLQRWGLYYALHCMLSANNQMHALPTQSHD